MNTPHLHADILRAIADGKTVQRYKGANIWVDATLICIASYPDDEFRISPETITLAGHEFPSPVRELLKDGQDYWTPRLEYLTPCDCWTWTSHVSDKRNLKRGLIQLTKEGAIAQAKAMIAACGGEV